MPNGTIGVTLKSLRKERKLTLKELAEQTNVSISFLSQVERGKSSVTLESLRKIADALNVDPSLFFANETEKTDWESRLEKFHYKDLSHGVKEANLVPMLVIMKPAESEGNPFAHSGYEFLFVLDGVLTVEVDGERTELTERQSIMFDARKRHYWFNLTEHDVQFLLVSSKTN
ncbi:DNA-binding protein [Planococcus donghaensis MPA1U2]|uniref:DNA-binding protein n=1 Tax=Planococcus donghaensis MPA1U2 TaxID=933115 RepID=E7RKQ5_9BACL|nr:XRE family transcriptional regulator [Planococcus donghaensis]EGA88485.1 DNA-binding protein [Planococcus donghaensis MPA1U2]